MKKLLIYFSVHLFVIFTTAFDGFIRQMQPNKETATSSKSIPILGLLKVAYNSRWIRPYTILSGVESGYGFYGKNVSTNKFFIIELYNKDSSLIKTINYAQTFNTASGLSRFETLPAKLYNFIVETEDLKKNSIERDSGQTARIIRLREQYAEKIFKYIAKSVIKDAIAQRHGITDNVKKTVEYYKVKFFTIVPPQNIFNQSNRERHTIFVLKEQLIPAI